MGGTTDTFDKNNDEVAACAVCEHESAASVYVQWGRKTCSNDQQTVYSGLMMSVSSLGKKAELICVDWERSPTATSTSKARVGGFLTRAEWGPNEYNAYKSG